MFYKTAKIKWHHRNRKKGTLTYKKVLTHTHIFATNRKSNLGRYPCYSFIYDMKCPLHLPTVQTLTRCHLRDVVAGLGQHCSECLWAFFSHDAPHLSLYLFLLLEYIDVFCKQRITMSNSSFKRCRNWICSVCLQEFYYAIFLCIRKFKSYTGVKVKWYTQWIKSPREWFITGLQISMRTEHIFW